MISLQPSSHTARGFGGLLLIAVLGLAVLVFGGILVNLRQIGQARDAVTELSLTLSSQDILKPLDQSVQDAQAALRAPIPPQPQRRPTRAEEIPSLRDGIFDLARGAGLEVLSASPVLETGEGSGDRLRFDVRLRGPYRNLRPFLDALATWPREGLVEAFTVRAVPGGEEIQVLYRMPLS